MLELIRPDAGLHREWLDFLADYDRPGLDGGSVSDDLLPVMGDPGVFRTWVEQVRAREHGRELPEGRVSSTSRWALRDGEIVGVIDLRHELTDLLLAWGGHIGYAVRVCARRQGVATEMLRQTLAVATRLGINPVLVTCDEDNVGSRRTIKGAGGVYDGSVEGKRRYWITAADTPIGYAARPLGLDPLRGRLVDPAVALTRADRRDPCGRLCRARADPSALRPDWAPGVPSAGRPRWLHRWPRPVRPRV
jgi:predicted acetyltransferase